MRKSRPANRVDETTVLMRREREGRTASRVDKMREIRPANRANQKAAEGNTYPQLTPSRR